MHVWTIFFFLNENNFSTVSSRVGKQVDLELYFNVDFIYLTAAEGYFEVLCYPSLGVSLLDVLCFRVFIFPLFNGFDREGKTT